MADVFGDEGMNDVSSEKYSSVKLDPALSAAFKQVCMIEGITQIEGSRRAIQAWVEGAKDRESFQEAAERLRSLLPEAAVV